MNEISRKLNADDLILQALREDIQAKKLAEKEENVIFGGRLGDYKYYDMDKVIAAALEQLEEME